jgi:hypothetical protein
MDGIPFPEGFDVYSICFFGDPYVIVFDNIHSFTLSTSMPVIILFDKYTAVPAFFDLILRVRVKLFSFLFTV